jgi:hypothetical protein
MFDTAPEVQADHPRQTLIGDKNYYVRELQGGKSPAGVAVRVLSRTLALTAAIWHNDKTGQPVKRSPTAYQGFGVVA